MLLMIYSIETVNLLVNPLCTNWWIKKNSTLVIFSLYEDKFENSCNDKMKMRKNLFVKNVIKLVITGILVKYLQEYQD